MKRLATSVDRFLRDEAGALLVFWGVSFVMLLGIVALSFDLGRLGITRSDLQSFADSVALAAAGELDGNDDAITRATAAAANLISDRQTFGNGDRLLQGADDYTLTFLSTLPASDTAAATATTTDPRRAVYARVKVNDTTVSGTFAAAFAALTGGTGMNELATATAIAGFTQYACDVTPLMFCLPGPEFKADDNVGKMIRLRAGGNGAAWGPGDFGFLDPAKIEVDGDGPCKGLNGVKLDACLLGAIGSITQCFDMRGVDMEPGQKSGIEDAIFNTRFDIYQSIMNGEKNNPDYAPAPNVIKGVVPKGKGGSCISNNGQASPDTMALPRDTNLCDDCDDRIGNGNWTAARADYVNINHGGADPDSNAKTRYALYRAEIQAHGGAGSSTSILSDKAETGRPMCSNNQSADPDRRVIVAAGIDCAANSIKGATTNVPVKEFFKIFLTEPVGTYNSKLQIYGEIVGSAGGSGAGVGATGGIFRDVVQLYR
ncbi:pilus assembly protein TadG-related protein [Seohaeicola zhoushanensis]|uniref:Putative Flp pilus-assembly TadG-like N-terminal domain-containing protein n=1 Tax=Seohaeicola zhoushanensis TaxID=1569283 RepID=A0A8J3GYP4_9RHOB|nr:Tad domain-containing protein [Seohaeicola zhoushanensis]GHF58957.1 hypothetical protein GCM10017056_33010 [Seohaeicola zhoushanensis]